jgi:hypothetical protein
MWSYAGPTVAVKLFVDKENQKVLFAESDKDSVDVLFSFLTMPLGTIVRILGKQSGVGCLDELYKSVESLSIDHFQTEACKTLLLRPHNAAARQCERLKVRVDDTNPRAIYLCSNTECLAVTFSSVPDVVCIHKCKPYGCNGRHSRHMELPENDNAVVGFADGGGFVQSGLKFIITDDLQVSPASTSLVFSMLDNFGLNEMVLNLNSSKVSLSTANTIFSSSFRIYRSSELYMVHLEYRRNSELYMFLFR